MKSELQLLSIIKSIKLMYYFYPFIRKTNKDSKFIIFTNFFSVDSSFYTLYKLNEQNK